MPAKKPAKPKVSKAKPKAAKSRAAKPKPVALAKPAKIDAYFDGACEPINPGGTASFGAVVLFDGKAVWQCSRLFETLSGREKETSNNVAEYSGLLSILDWLKEKGVEDVSTKIHGDSKLVIEQMSRNWKIKAGHYVPLAEKALQMLDNFKRRPIMQWISREENNLADDLSKAELRKAGVQFRIQVEG